MYINIYIRLEGYSIIKIFVVLCISDNIDINIIICVLKYINIIYLFFNKVNRYI